MQISLGDTGITTSTLALGCARIGSALTPLGRRASIALIEEACDLGIRHFDTASIYGQGDSERYLGAALQRRRRDVCIASKAGQLLSHKQAVLAQFKTPLRFLIQHYGRLRGRVAQQRARGVPRCFDPGYIARSLEGSLHRLRTEYLDVFYLHSPDPVVLQDGALLDSMQKWQRQGRVRAIGVSCDEIAVAWAAAKCDAVKIVQFAFADDESSHGLLAELSRRRKVAVLRGLMQPRAGDCGQAPVLTERFAHALSLPALGGVIVGTTNAAHLRQNVAAFRSATHRGTMQE